jgi:transposase
MTLTIVDQARPVTGGVDTHADTHVAAALDGIGGLLGVQEFAAAPAGYARLLGWLRGFGAVGLVGIEGTGSYGSGLARHIAAAGIRVVEVDRSDRQDRRRHGKSDPLDAVSAARAALSGRASGAPRGRDGEVKAIRALMVAKRTARAQRTQTINQARALIITGPDDVRARFTGQTPAELAALRPRPGSMVRYHTLLALRELGRRAQYLDGQLTRLDGLITRWSRLAPPACSACSGSARTPPRCCSSRPGITPAGPGPKRPGRTCAPRRRSRHPPARRRTGTGSTAAATGRPTMPCGGS